MAFLSITSGYVDRPVYTTAGNTAVSVVTGTALVVRPGTRSLADAAPRRGSATRIRARESSVRGALAYSASEPVLRGMFYDSTV